MGLLRVVAAVGVVAIMLGAGQVHAAGGGGPLTAAQRKQLSAHLQRGAERSGAVGQTVTILRDGQPVFSDARGRASLELAVPATQRTVYALFSASKLFTSVAVMQLVEAGKLELDAPLSRYLEDLPAAWRKVTVRQALSHRSGLPEYANAPPSMLPRKAAEALKSVADQPLQFEPGSATRYTQTNYLLLVQAIEKLTGQDFVTAMAQRVGKPAGLAALHYGGSSDLVAGRATSYRGSPGGLRVDAFDFPPYAFGGAGLNASAPELAAWVRALVQGRLVSANTLKGMWQPEVGPDGAPHPYSHGWQLERAGDITAVGHSGGGRVDVRHFVRGADGRSVTVILLRNGTRQWAPPHELSARLAEVLMPGALFPLQALKDAMVEAVEAGDVERALTRYRAFRTDAATRGLPTEPTVNMAAYELMGALGPERALPLFELNAAEHPDSGNAHDSLGEALAALGDVERATRHYARSLELDPGNANARRMLEELGRRRKGTN